MYSVTEDQHPGHDYPLEMGRIRYFKITRRSSGSAKDKPQYIIFQYYDWYYRWNISHFEFHIKSAHILSEQICEIIECIHQTWTKRGSQNFRNHIEMGTFLFCVQDFLDLVCVYKWMITILRTNVNMFLMKCSGYFGHKPTGKKILGGFSPENRHSGVCILFSNCHHRTPVVSQ